MAGQPEALVEAVKAALADDATPEAKAAAAAACRTLVAVFQADQGEPLASAPSASPAVAMAQHMAGAPPSAVLDAVITRLQALVPDEPAAVPTPALRIPFVPIPKTPGGKR